MTKPTFPISHPWDFVLGSAEAILGLRKLLIKPFLASRASCPALSRSGEFGIVVFLIS